MKAAKEIESPTLLPSSAAPLGLPARYEFLMSRPAQRIREMTEKTLKPLKITPKQYGILSALQFAGPLTQRMIGEMLKIDRTTMVQLVDALEGRGLLVREDHPKDRRYYLLHLTAAGKESFKKAHKLVMKAEDEFLKPLHKTERQSLRRFLSKLFDFIPSQLGNAIQ